METEKNGELPFLDVLVKRQENGALTPTVYRKATATDRMLPSDSLHPRIHKTNCIRALWSRINTHCSTTEEKECEAKFLQKQFAANGYSRKFVIQSLKFRQPHTQGPQESAHYRAIPYISGVSEGTSRLLAPYGIRIAHKPNGTTRNLLSYPKDKVPHMEQAEVVYRINCKDCPAHYTGETSKSLRTRTREHQGSARRQETTS